MIKNATAAVLSIAPLLLSGCEQPPEPPPDSVIIKGGAVYNSKALLAAANSKIGPSGPDDHAAWALTYTPLR